VLFLQIQQGTWGDVALSLHVFGAVILMGGLVTAASTAIIGWNSPEVALRRLSYKTLLFVGFPGWIAMRFGGQWIYSREHWGEGGSSDPTWLGIGYMTADIGGLLLLIALILGGIGLRKLRTGGGSGLLKASSVLATLLVAIYIITVWAMGAKPA
jgi:hypothetical protein